MKRLNIKTMPLAEIFSKVWELLDARERRNAILLFCMILVMGLLEVVGIASVMPFIAVVAEPSMVEKNEYLSALYNGLGFSSVSAFLKFLGVVVFVLVVGSLSFKALTQWAMVRYSSMRNYTLSSRLLRGYLGRPYTFFLNRHSSDLGKAVLSEVRMVTKKALLPTLQLVSNSVVAVFLISLIVVVNPWVALVAVTVIGGAYAVMYVSVRRVLIRIGTQRVEANKARFRIAHEAIGGIKEVKVHGLEDGYLRSFRQPASRLARVQAFSRVIGELPQYALRAFVAGGMIALLVGLLEARNGDLGTVLPLIGVYYAAGTRLIPALQQVYRSLTVLRFGKPALDVLHRDLVKTGQAGAPLKTKVKEIPPKPVRVFNQIKLDHVTFTYEGTERPALDGLSLIIPARTTVGFVGSTGAGKTTAVDVILGLLVPERGNLLVDDRKLTKRDLRGWQRNLGYVPQSICLTDDTVAGNIAFGVSKEKINQKKIENAARIAGLHDFVTNELPDGYQTHVGDRGVRLSGGQRQRVGIARALYYDPDVLVFDEATSALDNVTERGVMDAVHNLSHRKTIILIAHRLTTVQECDQIFFLEHGKLASQGTYDELLEKSEQFRRMAGEDQKAVVGS